MEPSTAKEPQLTPDLPEKLAAPAQRALTNAGISSLKQLSGFRETTIAGLHGIGKNALGQLRQALANAGLSFADEEKK